MRVRYSFSSRRTGQIEGRNNHRVPFPKIARQVINDSDVILQVLDARFVEKTRNLELENKVKKEGKKLMYVINKSDLVNPTEFKKNVDVSGLNPHILFSCKTRAGKRKLTRFIKIEAKKLNLDRKANVGIIGFPNTGKSSLINLLVGRKGAGTSAQAGFTKGIQKIRLNSDISIIDTPGVIPDEEYDVKNKDFFLKKHTQIGVRTYDKVKDPELIVHKLMAENPQLFEIYYRIDADGDSEIILEEIGRKNNYLKKGNEVNMDRAARHVLKDWQDGKIKKHNS